MDQEPVPAPSEPTDGKPRIFQNINGVIAGVTGLVIAVGGLAAATKDLWSSKEAEQPVETASTTSGAEPAQSQSLTSTGTKPPVARPAAYKGKLYNAETGAYDGATVLLTKEGARWVLTAGDTDWEYDEIVSPDQAVILAKSTEYTSKMRWPVEGGVMKESTTSGTDDWEYYADIRPVSASPSN